MLSGTLVVFIAVALGPVVGAQPAGRDAEVKNLLESGIRATRQGDYETAYNQFRRANELGPSAQTLSQLGLAENRLKKWSDGEAHLTAALRLLQGQPSGPVRPALESALADAKTHVGILHVLGTSGATVTIDGHLETRLPSEGVLRLSEGKRHLQAKAAGYESQEVDVSIEGQREFKVTFFLRRLQARLPQPALTARATPAAPQRGSRLFDEAGIGGLLMCLGAGPVASGVLLLSYDIHPATGRLLTGGGLAIMSVGLYTLWRGLHERPTSLALAFGSRSLIVQGQF